MAVLDGPEGATPNSEEEAIPTESKEDAGPTIPDEQVSLTDPGEDEDDEDEPEGWDNPQAWEQLLYAIRSEQCTPFLGSGASVPVLRTGKTIAVDWAEHYGYPFSDSDNLPRVSQFVAIMNGALLPRQKLKDEFTKAGLPDFNNPNEPHAVVANLGLPVYITTNYDNFMTKALQAVGRDPIQECCQWHKVKILSQTQLKGVGSSIEPTPEKPVVFHLHGYLNDLNSMVLTEDDYLNFLINISEVSVLPSHIEAAFSNDKAFLFIGYSLEDMSFKVLFRKFAQQIATSPGDRHVAVQLHGTKGLSGQEKKKQREFLQKQFQTQNVKVYWGKAQRFSRSLRERWAAFP